MDRSKVEQYRLALFGRMVMGVSHEVDNYLSVVLGFAELIQISGGGEKKTLDGVAKILHAGEKINTITRHFSHHVRPHPPAAESFSPGDVLRECLVFARYDLGRNSVALALPEELPPAYVTGDRRDFALALLALMFNGAEAMEPDGGALRLEVSRRDRFLDFIVTDQGPGVPPEFAARVFDEGFTTKDGSLHAGMGLPVARHLATQMGGTVSLANLAAGGCQAVLTVPGS